MTKRLEDIFDLPSSIADTDETVPDIATPARLDAINDAINKIDAALPMVRGLEASDSEMDDLAALAKDSYTNLMDLGMNVDSRFAAEIFATAGTMLGHAITAKTAKLNKKLKMIDLQLKKAKLDQTTIADDNPPQFAHGTVLSRNDLLERLVKSKDQNVKDV